MKRNIIYKPFIIIILLILIVSCSKEPALKPTKDTPPTNGGVDLPTLATTDPTGVTYTTISIGGKVEKKGSVSIIDRGVCWSTSPNPDVSGKNTGVVSVSGTGEFSSLVTDLIPGIKYYLKAFVKTKDNCIYGNEKIVTTLDIGLPVLSTDSTIIIGKNTARFGGTIIQNGGSDIITTGVCYGTSPNPTIQNNKVLPEEKNNKFLCILKDLNPNTTYYVRSFATNAKGTGYGPPLTFKTIVGGNVSYTIWKSDNPSDIELDAYRRIKEAMDIAIFYYNTYTNINKVLTIEYAPWVSTADGSYNGHIRFGKETVYMNPGTCQHEITHTIGVGTVPLWWSGRDLIVNGIYTGHYANAVHQWITNDPTATITEDGEAHFKPYQFNNPGAYQSTMDYIYHALVMEGMRKDGLPISE